jgi:rare lipoprotein A
LRFEGQFKPALVGTGLALGARKYCAAASVLTHVFALVLTLCLAACGSGGNGEHLGERVVPLGQPVPKGGGFYQIGKPYEVAGLVYTPREEPTYDRVGTASWYGELFHGRRTANGEIYDMDRLSAAHPTLPLPVYARVTNLNNGRSIVVRINDRGPYARDRIIDLSRRSAELLGFRGNGTATVRVKYLGRAPLSGDDSYEWRYLASQSWARYALKGGSATAKGAPTEVGSISEKLPLENPENLARPWKAVAPPGATEPTPPGWSATTRPTGPLQAQFTGSIPKDQKPVANDQKSVAAANGPTIQAGSFKSKDNADRARTTLSAIAPVDVAEVTVGHDVYYRVRVGPFQTVAKAKAALGKVTQAGYRGAKLTAQD